MTNAVNNEPITGDYVLDSYAILAYFEAEPGSEQVQRLLEAVPDRALQPEGQPLLRLLDQRQDRLVARPENHSSRR